MSGYYSMRNLNEDTNKNWYYEDKTLSGYLYNGFMLDTVNGRPEYDKEMLKRTMLEQDAIFRKQVYELHRLYRIQKDLVDELKMKELYRFSVPRDTSLSDFFSSQMSFKVTDKAWQMPCLPTGNSSYNGASAAGINETRLPLNFLKESSLQSSPVPSRNCSFLKDGELLDPKVTKVSRNFFDLQLPAHAYIDNEDAERAEKDNVANSSFRATNPLDTIGAVEPENDVKLSLSFGEDFSFRNDGSHPQNGLSIHMLDDLNEPTKDISFEGEAGPSATKFLCVTTYHEGMQAHKLPNSRSHLQGDFFIDSHRDDGTCSNFFSGDMEESRQEWPLIYNEVGQSRRDAKSFNPSSCNEKLPVFVKPTPLEHTRSHEIALPDDNKAETWFGDKAGNGTELSRRRSSFASSFYSRQAVPQMPTPSSVVPHADYYNTASPPISTWRKRKKSINHIPIAVQALPCFNVKSNPTNGSLNGFDCGFRTNSSSSAHFQPSSVTFSTPNLCDHIDKSVYANSEGRGWQNCFKTLQFSDVKPAVDARSNWVLTNGIRDGLSAQQDVKGNHNEESSGGTLWFRTKPACSRSTGAKECAPRMESGFSQDYFTCSRSTNDTSCSVRDRLHHTNLWYDVKVPSSKEQVHVGISSKGLRNHINLNSVVSCMDLRNSSENSPEDEAEVASPLSLQSIAGKVAPKIDLEVLVAAEGEESLTPQVEIIGMNHRATPVQMPSSITDGRQETECSHETLVRVAAENLVTMSSEVLGCSVDPTRPLTLPSCTSLRWFAGIVSSNAESAKASKGGGYGDAESSDDAGLDYFESATLKLKETKEDECRSRPRELENEKDEGRSTASMLLTRPRRGQSSRRRQRRDFKKDVLPGLASLSRNEVTEDLQAFGGLMRSSCRSSQAGSARRCMSGTGFPCQAKGRRRPRSLTVTVAEIRVNPTPTQIARTELELDGRTIIGWGRTTKRCRGQRVPSVNASALLT